MELNSTVTPYDKTAEFEEYIAPLIEEVLTLCKAHRIPLSLCFATKNTDEKTDYTMFNHTGPASGRILKRDIFADLTLCYLGAKVVPQGIPEMEPINFPE